MIKNNFVAVDFETAQPPNRFPIFICQVGIIVVENGEIVERISLLVQPPNNKYVKSCSDIHGITAKTTKDSDTFDVVWKSIEKYFINTTLIAHNAYDFDEKVLWQNLDYYNISPKGINKFIDTKLLYNTPSRSLASLCVGFDIDCENHHDACFDAECCANIYLKFLQNEEPDCDKIRIFKDENIKPNVKSFIPAQERILSSEVKVKDLSIVDNKNNFFYDKKVVISGILDTFPVREKLALILKNFGADINSSVSKKTNIFIMGKDCGPAKMEKVLNLKDEGFDIKIMEEEELNIILSQIK